eukprot:scaffold662_cov364-Pavlova_lutheri.AAC.70
MDNITVVPSAFAFLQDGCAWDKYAGWFGPREFDRCIENIHVQNCNVSCQRYVPARNREARLSPPSGFLGGLGDDVSGKEFASHRLLRLIFEKQRLLV